MIASMAKRMTIPRMSSWLESSDLRLLEVEKGCRFLISVSVEKNELRLPVRIGRFAGMACPDGTVPKDKLGVPGGIRGSRRPLWTTSGPGDARTRLNDAVGGVSKGIWLM